MFRTRWRKVILDLLGNKMRTFLVIAAITVGVFAVGFIASAQEILLRELNKDYEEAAVASATIYTQPFNSDLVDNIANMPAVSTAEGRRSLGARVSLSEGVWRELSLTAIADYNNIHLDRIIPVAGNWPPLKNEVVIEQLSLDFLEAEVGDTLILELGNEVQKELTIVGLVYDNRVPSADLTNTAFGYITADTLASLGQGEYFTELRFSVAENQTDEAHIRQIATQIEEKVERSGRDVFSTRIPPPGEHWAEDIITTLVLLFFVFGGLILFLSSFLVVNTMSALITQQVQQIGVMKLIGAQRPQIITMYVVMVLLYGLTALLIGIPLGVRAGGAAVDYAAQFLNVTVEDYSVSITVIAIQAAVGLFVPILAASWPVLNGVQITTHRALNSSGVDQGAYGHGLVDRFFVKLQQSMPLQRPVIISLRNTIRRKGRLILTLLTLIMGTGLFISVLTVRDSVEKTVSNFLNYHGYDVRINYSRPYRVEQLEQIAQQGAAVTHVESWNITGARRIRDDDSESTGFRVVALPPTTQLVNPVPEVGRWLEAEDTNAIVLNTFLLNEESDLQLGDELTLRINGRETVWQVVGAVPAAAAGDSEVYVSYDYYSYITRTRGQANSLQILAGRHDAPYQAQLESALVTHFETAGYQISSSQTSEALRADLNLRFEIVVLFLVMMAILLAIVGGLGLTTTMSINILERIREIGVIRAIGASNTAVRQIVVVEGIVIGFLSWLIGTAVAVPLSMVMSQQVGLALLRMPLDYRFSWSGTIFWLVTVLLIAIVASLGPAYNASRLTIREVLAYE